MPSNAQKVLPPDGVVDDYETRVEALITAARLVHDIFASGHHPTERQLNRLDGAILGLTAEKTCGHRITEDCSCDDGEMP